MWLVRPDTRAKVQSVARELGYRADVVARSLRRGQTTTVGVVVADLGNTFVAPALHGITEALERHGFMALISETQDDHERLRASVENLLSRRVDGMIVMAARLGDASVIETIVGEEQPIVLAVRTLPGSPLPSRTTTRWRSARWPRSAPRGSTVRATCRCSATTTLLSPGISIRRSRRSAFPATRSAGSPRRS